MFELIDPAFPDAASDDRLVPILSEIMKLQTEIQSAQWEGRDCYVIDAAPTVIEQILHGWSGL